MLEEISIWIFPAYSSGSGSIWDLDFQIRKKFNLCDSQLQLHFGSFFTEKTNEQVFHSVTKEWKLQDILGGLVSVSSFVSVQTMLTSYLVGTISYSELVEEARRKCQERIPFFYASKKTEFYLVNTESVFHKLPAFKWPMARKELETYAQSITKSKDFFFTFDRIDLFRTKTSEHLFSIRITQVPFPRWNFPIWNMGFLKALLHIYQRKVQILFCNLPDHLPNCLVDICFSYLSEIPLSEDETSVIGDKNPNRMEELFQIFQGIDIWDNFTFFKLVHPYIQRLEWFQYPEANIQLKYKKRQFFTLNYNVETREFSAWLGEDERRWCYLLVDDLPNSFFQDFETNYNFLIVKAIEEEEERNNSQNPS